MYVLRYFATFGCLILTTLLFGIAHHEYPTRPTAGLLGNGWWGGFDQGQYLVATHALAKLDFAPATQNYEPGYAVLAVPFVHLTPSDPFFIPDLAALLLACWLFGHIGQRLLANSYWARPVSMLIFVLTTVGDPLTMPTWVVPWTTTPMAPLLLGALLSTLAFLDQPRPWPCFIAAISSCAIITFRPGDAIIVALPCFIIIVWELIRYWPGYRAGAVVVLAGVAGVACALVPAAVLHDVVWGMRANNYMLGSHAIGFNFRLLPLRWVLVVIGPVPLTAGRGIAAAFPWVISGAAGMLACLVIPGREGRGPHALFVATAALSFVLFLTYRDLHPAGIWIYGNLHYFKCLLPIFALYTFVLGRELLTARHRISLLLIASGAVVVLFCWRPQLHVMPSVPNADIVQAPHHLTLMNGLPYITDAVLVAAEGNWADIYASRYHAYSPTRDYLATGDFKAYPRTGGFLLIPLRPILPDVTFVFPDGVRLNPSVPPIPIRQDIVFAPPCWLVHCSQLN
jgi:hypothetical protein